MTRRHGLLILAWVVIVIVLGVLLYVYPKDTGPKKLLLSTVGNAYVYGSLDNRFIPLGLADPTRSVLFSGYKDGPMISYLKFSLSSIPKSNDVISINIDSAVLRLLTSSASGNQTKFFLTVNSCDNNNWSNSSITYDNRVCPKNLKGEDSIVVNASSLPEISTWDVTNSIIHASEKNQSQITYAITAFPVLKDRDIGDIITESQLGDTKVLTRGYTVHFWPSEQRKLSDSAIPTLMITAITIPKPFINYLYTVITIILPIGGALLTIIPMRQ